MVAEDRLHAFGMPGADGITAGLGRAERLEVYVSDAGLIQGRGELAFGKAGFARLRNRPDIDQQRHIRAEQRAHHGVDRGSLIADRKKPGHVSAVRQPVLDQPPRDAVGAGQGETVLLSVAHFVAAEPAGVLEFFGVDGDFLGKALGIKA